MEFLSKLKVYCFGNYCTIEVNNLNTHADIEVSTWRDYKQGFCQS